MSIIHNELIIYSGVIINTSMVIKRIKGAVKEQICVTVDKDVIDWIDERSGDGSRSKEINILLREIMNIKKLEEAKKHGGREIGIVGFMAQTG